MDSHHASIGDYARMRLVIGGRVQGVFFRQSAVNYARGLGLRGWVRNRADGSVELVAEGRRDALQMLRAWARQGPPAARVDEATEEWIEFTNEFSAFRIR